MKNIQRIFLSIIRNTMRSTTMVVFFSVIILVALISQTFSMSIFTLKEQILNKSEQIVLITNSYSDTDTSRKEEGAFVPLNTSNTKSITELDEVQTIDYSYRDFFVTDLLAFSSSEATPKAGGLLIEVVGSELELPIKSKLDREEVITGKHFSQQQLAEGLPVVIVHDAFADRNNIVVGDFIEAKSILYESPLDKEGKTDLDLTIKWQKNHSLEVVGIVKQKQQNQLQMDAINKEQTNNELMFEINEHTMYVPNNYLNKTLEEKNALLSYDASDDNSLLNFSELYLKIDGSSNQNAFVDNIKATMDPSWEITTMDDQLKKIIGFMHYIEDIFQRAYPLLIMMSICIFVLYIFLNLRERKQEIGIYIALGDSKKNVIGIILMEYLFLFLTASIIAVGSSMLFSQSLTEKIITNQLAQQNSSEDTSALVSVTALSEYTRDQVTHNIEAFDYQNAASNDIGQILLILILIFIAICLFSYIYIGNIKVNSILRR